MLDPQDNDTRHIKCIKSTCEFKQVIKEATRITSDNKTLTNQIATNRSDRAASSGVIYHSIIVHDVVYGLKVEMKCFLFVAEFKRAAKIRKIAVYRFLISLLVPEL